MKREKSEKEREKEREREGRLGAAALTGLPPRGLAGTLPQAWGEPPASSTPLPMLPGLGCPE